MSNPYEPLLISGIRRHPEGEIRHIPAEEGIGMSGMASDKFLRDYDEAIAFAGSTTDAFVIADWLFADLIANVEATPQEALTRTEVVDWLKARQRDLERKRGLINPPTTRQKNNAPCVRKDGLCVTHSWPWPCESTELQDGEHVTEINGHRVTYRGHRFRCINKGCDRRYMQIVRFYNDPAPCTSRDSEDD